MSIDQRRLVDAAMQLRAGSPTEWQQFCLALSAYAANVTIEMVRSPPELLLRAQGMAIAAHEIATIMNDAAKLKDQFMEAQARQARKTSGSMFDVTNGRDQQL
jgi:hypothetical protein